MAQIQAQFILSEVARVQCSRFIGAERRWVAGEGVRVKLAPATGEPFGSATPGGNVEMVIANPEAAKVFADAPLGQAFDFLISPVEKE